MPDGNKSTQLTCFECGKSQAYSYLTDCGKHICFDCKDKDKEGLLEETEIAGFVQY